MDCTYFKNDICVATGTNCIGADCDGYITDIERLKQIVEKDVDETPAE